MKVLVIGHKGQLGTEFCTLLDSRKIEYRGHDIDTLDICKIDELDELVSYFRPHFIINCAAYNHVDLAETNYHLAYDVNAAGIRNIATSAEKYGAFVIHFGSDYIFDGKKGSPYLETDETNPLNNYGRSKLEGEKLLAATTENFISFRVSWIYGPGNQNFIFKLSEWASKQAELKIANDEISVPTSTKTISTVVMKAIDNGLRGTYHLTNSGYASRYEWAEEILKISNLNNKITPVSKDSFNLPALRPSFSAMANNLLSQELNVQILHWKDALSAYFSNKV